MLKATNINKSFGKIQILKNISLEIPTNEVVSIIGASGAGKSTLLQIIGTLDAADKGEVFIKDTAIAKLNQKELSKFRNEHIGFIFQFHNLLSEFNALENVCIPGFISNKPESEVKAKAKELLDMLGMSHRLKNKPSELSGGEQQRVSVARSLINSPSIIFADEPSGNLDSKNAEELHKLFFQLRKDLHKTFVIVTHNKELAAMSDRIIEMKDGEIINN